MTDRTDVFLSYSHTDREAAINLRGQLDRRGLSVFKDTEGIREGDLWLGRLQDAVDGCGAFVVLVGRDGVGRWIGAETQVALNRYFAPHEDAERLPIFPILLGEAAPETLPAFLRLFQATPWNGTDPLPERLLDQIRERTIVADTTTRFEGCPFVGLDAYRTDQAHLFFGRQKETLDALASFDRRPGAPTVRWLEINGNSGSGKSSLMNAGILPLVDQGWLWPRTGHAHWTCIGPMMPGAHPVEMLAEHLARTLGVKMSGVCEDLTSGDRELARLLRETKPDDDTAFLLAVDQFEEMFTFAEPEERRRFDRLLAGALEDGDCPLFVISTVRADFLDRFDDLPRLVAARNRVGKPWTLPPVGVDGLREIIDGPARLAGLDVSAVREAMVLEARDEPGALPLVENALHWLWEKRTDGRLSGKLLSDHGGVAGILSRCADDLLAGLEPRQREQALELLFRMTLIDPEGRRHTRRRISLAEAVDVAGGGDRGRDLVDRLAGRRSPDGGKAHGPLRLITVSEDWGDREPAAGHDRWVNLIHETLIRSKGPDAEGKAQPYWPTLWTYIERHKDRAARRERLQLLSREWKNRKGVARLSGLAGWSSFFGYRGLAARKSLEQRYLRWSRGRALVEMMLLAVVVGLGGESVYWARANEFPVEAALARVRGNLGIPDLPRLETLPAGAFQMGERDCKADGDRSACPERTVTLTAFEMSRNEVTFAQWTACLADGGCDAHMPRDEAWGRGDRPVIDVNWEHAKTYTDWLSGEIGSLCRLPSEAEWEYAARAGTTTEYGLPAPDGSDDIAGTGLANCSGCGGEWDERDRTAPVGSFPPNAWGLHDMHGNVWEWVEDCWHGSYKDAPEDGRAWLEENGGNCDRRVLRGGSWGSDQDFARSADRGWYDPSSRGGYVGFRVVCSSPSLNTDH